MTVGMQTIAPMMHRRFNPDRSEGRSHRTPSYRGKRPAFWRARRGSWIEGRGIKLQYSTVRGKK